MTAMIATAVGDPRLHAADGADADQCLCGAPVWDTSPVAFAGQDPRSCPICALALMRQAQPTLG